MPWSNEAIEAAREDFRKFLYIVWYHISLPEPTEIQFAMAHEVATNEADRLILQGFRGVAKSFITCAYCVWVLWRDPTLKVQMVSASGGKASLNSSFIKKIILVVPFLECLRLTDEDKRAGLKDTADMFDVHGAIADISPSVKSVGITGQLTGTRADVLIADDVEVVSNSGTQGQRDKLAELVKEFDAVLKPGGRIIYLGTPQCEDSLYTKLGARGYKTIIYPVLYPETAEEREFYGDNLGKILKDRYDSDPEYWAGKPTDPQRFSVEEIEKRRLSYGKAGFSLQFMLNTNLTDAERYPLRVSDLIVTDLDMEESSVKFGWAAETRLRIQDVPNVALRNDYYHAPLTRSEILKKYRGAVMHIDPSGRGKDETAYTITKFLNGYIFVMDVGGFRDGYTDTTLKLLAMKAKFWGVNEVIIEPNFGDGMFLKLIEPVFRDIYPCSVVETKPAKGMKEKRIIDILEPLMARHRIIMNTSVIRNDFKVFEKDSKYSLIYQMTRICAEPGALAHDDRIESLAEACRYWVEAVAVDQKQIDDEVLQKQLDQWLDPDKGIFYVEEIDGPRAVSNGSSFGNILSGFFNTTFK